MVQNALYPVLNETARVAGLAGLNAEPRFQDGEWAVLTEPSLKRDHANGDQVCRTPPKFVGPRSPCPVSDDDGRESQHNEQDDSEVHKKDGICKGSVGQRLLPYDGR